ncbi:MAG: stage III sporulation protein AF [Clostridia bacterium]|nr:stage III sporulation protein AF [Clostridia bacterium]
MINDLSSTASTLVAAVILITIIEMLLPSGNMKKYVKFFGGLILMLVIITPIINLFNSDIDIEKLIEENQIEVSNIEYEFNESHIYNSYNENLKLDIIKRLEENGYKVIDIKMVTDKNTYEPTDLELLIEHDDGDIQPVVIDVFKNASTELTSYDKEIIKTIINLNYGIKKANIKIN